MSRAIQATFGQYSRFLRVAAGESLRDRPGYEECPRRPWEHDLRVFRWLTANAIPPGLDLRECGWRLRAEDESEVECVGVARTTDMPPSAWIAFLSEHGRHERRMIVLVGIDDAVDRARLLKFGFGEVAASDLTVEELEARAVRLSELEDTLPRYRHVGPMSLDLLAREAYANDKPLGLHPREFGLLWRLADTPGEPVSKEELVRDVWRLGFVPETNSLAVHVSRLRGKLGVAKLEGLLETVPAGGYRLKVSSEDESGSSLGEIRERFDHSPREKAHNKAPAKQE